MVVQKHHLSKIFQALLVEKLKIDHLKNGVEMKEIQNLKNLNAQQNPQNTH